MIISTRFNHYFVATPLEAYTNRIVKVRVRVRVAYRVGSDIVQSSESAGVYQEQQPGNRYLHRSRQDGTLRG